MAGYGLELNFLFLLAKRGRYKGKQCIQNVCLNSQKGLEKMKGTACFLCLLMQFSIMSNKPLDFIHMVLYRK